MSSTDDIYDFETQDEGESSAGSLAHHWEIAVVVVVVFVIAATIGTTIFVVRRKKRRAREAEKQRRRRDEKRHSRNRDSVDSVFDELSAMEEGDHPEKRERRQK